MKESYWGYWLLVLGVFVVVVLLLVQSFTSTNTQDYYMVKAITEAAMEDAIDYGYYRTYGEAKINKEKFEESFIRRFSEEASLTTTYEISFYDLYEAPPKVSVQVSSKSGGFSVSGDSNDIDIVNKIDAILETSTYSSKVTQIVQDPEMYPADAHDPKYAAWFETTVPVENYYQYYDCDINFAHPDCEGAKTGTIVMCGYASAQGIEEGNMKPGYVYCMYASSNNKCIALYPGNGCSKLTCRAR